MAYLENILEKWRKRPPRIEIIIPLIDCHLVRLIKLYSILINQRIIQKCEHLI